jgi:ethanolamine utilization cobalamin adenosyltransferase
MGEMMTDATQNIVNALQEQQHERMNRLNALQRDAQRHAFEAVVNRSWKARQDFRDLVEAADQLSDEIALTGMALAEAHSRLQSRGRDVAEVLKELNFGESE